MDRAEFTIRMHERWCERNPDKVDEEILRTEEFLARMRVHYREGDAEARERIKKGMESFVIRLEVLKQWRERNGKQ